LRPAISSYLIGMAHVVAEIMRWFEDYKVLEGKAVEVGQTISRADAVEIRAGSGGPEVPREVQSISV